MSQPSQPTPTGESQQTDEQKSSTLSAGNGSSSHTDQPSASGAPEAAVLADAPTAEQLAKLRPELRSIATRYGTTMLEFAVRVAGANAALDWMQAYSAQHSRVKPHALLLMDAQAHFCNLVMEAKGWKWDDLGQCMLDIARAAQLAQPAAGPVN